MTRQEVKTMVESIGLAYDYYQFPEGTAQPCPFLIFYYGTSSDPFADNSNYASITGLVIELYTDSIDFSLQADIEAALKANGLTYTRSEEYIDSERMHMTTYESEVLING